MPEACDVKFRVVDVPPNIQHFPEANIVKDQQARFRRTKCREVLQESPFKDPVFRAVAKNQVAFI